MLRVTRWKGVSRMADYWIWWLVAALLVGLELATGTFYLLAVGVAFALGGGVALLGASAPVQLLVGGALAVVAVIIAHRWRLRRGAPTRQAPLDHGQAVQVDAWNPDGTARVVYRGTQWNAEVAGHNVARADTMYIVDTRGSVLVLSDRRP
jgi:membrane protein implicated in regulation of membrane protease activity